MSARIKATECFVPDWEPRQPEFEICYEPNERKKYGENDDTGRYFDVRWNPEPVNEKRRKEIEQVAPGP
jgi:hypothetical protein